MRFRASCALLLCIFASRFASASGEKTYKHASEYQVAVLDQTIRLHTGTDATLGRSSTDAKLDQGGQGIHFLHTDAGDYRVEAPVNTGASILAAMGTPAYQTAPTIHNKWFLDKVQPNTSVLFAVRCASPNKKHPNEAVRCTFWFPDPDSESHEYMTLGDFTPYLIGNGGNTAKVANVLCGTGKLNADTEAKLCASPTPSPARIDPKLKEQIMANAAASKNSDAAVAANASTGHVSSGQELRDMTKAGQASQCLVITSPAGADLYIDGNKASKTPMTFVLIRHDETPRVLTIKLLGYRTVEKEYVPDGKDILLDLKLEPESIY